MGGSNWSDKSSVAQVLSFEQKKEIAKYCEEYQDQPWPTTADHFTAKFGFPISGDQIFSIYTESVANPSLYS